MADKTRSVNIVIAAKDAATAVLGKVGLAVAGVGAAVFAAKQVFDVLSGALQSVVTAAAKQEDADVALAAALRTVGDNTAGTRAKLDAFASSMQDVTTVDDQVVSGMLGILTSLGRLRGDGLERAAKAALDFAAATGTDATSAALLFAKAADGSTAGLSRYGIKVDEGLSKTEAFAQLLGITERKFGGLAVAMGQTFNAALARISKHFTDVEKTIGTAIVKSEGFRIVMETVSNGLKDLNALLKANPQLLKDLEEGLLKGTIAVVDLGLAFVSTTASVIESKDSILRYVDTVLSAASRLPGIFGPVASGLAALVPTLAPAEDGTDTLERSMAALQTILDAARASLAKLRNELDSVAPGLKTGSDVAADLGKGTRSAADGADEAKDSFKAFGLEGLKVAKEQAVELRAKMAEALSALLIGDLTQEQFDILSANILDAGEKLKEFGVNAFEMLGKDRPFESWADDVSAFNLALNDSQPSLERLGFTLQNANDVIGRALVDSSLQLGDALVDAAFEAGQSWDKFFQDLLKAIAKAIVKMLILRAISAAFSGGSSSLIDVTSGFDVNIRPGGQHGGLVRGGVPGLDSVAALLAPGEIVLPSSLRDDFQALAEAARGTSRGGATRLDRPALQMFNRFEATADLEKKAIELMETMSDLAERKGFRLVATELVG